jgi:hypothetical protein
LWHRLVARVAHIRLNGGGTDSSGVFSKVGFLASIQCIKLLFWIRR